MLPPFKRRCFPKQRRCQCAECPAVCFPWYLPDSMPLVIENNTRRKLKSHRICMPVTVPQNRKCTMRLLVSQKVCSLLDYRTGLVLLPPPPYSSGSTCKSTLATTSHPQPKHLSSKTHIPIPAANPPTPPLRRRTMLLNNLNNIILHLFHRRRHALLSPCRRLLHNNLSLSSSLPRRRRRAMSADLNHFAAGLAAARGSSRRRPAARAPDDVDLVGGRTRTP